MNTVIEKAAGASSNVSDRRRERRIRTERPVYVQPADPADDYFEEVLTMRDYSRDGFYFTSEMGPYYEGMKLYVIPALTSLNLEYLGEVVRVEPLGAAGYGVAVRLLRIRDLMVSARTATMSAYQSFALATRTPS